MSYKLPQNSESSHWGSPSAAPRLVKHAKSVTPDPMPAASVPPQARKRPARCAWPACDADVPHRGSRCPDHQTAWLAKRFHAPESPDAVFMCIAPACETRVPHREFLCERHWGMLTNKRRSKIRWLAANYRVHVGLALDDVAAQERASASTTPPDTAEDDVAYGGATSHEPLGRKRPTTISSDANRDGDSSNGTVI